jgi:hypothetical protein
MKKGILRGQGCLGCLPDGVDVSRSVEVKVSKDKRKVIDGKVFEKTQFSEKHSRVFKRLGMELVGVTEAGSAVVHMKPEIVSQLSRYLLLIRLIQQGTPY